MSRAKRPAASDLEDVDSNVTSSPLDSSSQIGSEGRKRRRIRAESDTTPEQPTDGPSQSSAVENSEGEDGEESDEDEAAATQAATQVLQAKKARDRTTGNVAKEAGVLEVVELRNFMCHRHFEYRLGPLINFICGKNGSGKSAILTAIIICLGGKASATNRGASLKRFIKEGAERASISCKIKNGGEDAYLPDTYGDRIIVERHFTRTGTSGYKICAGSGKVISTKRADLEAIVDHFSLQIDNPLNVLSQDMARSFLGGSQPGEKYKFFIKGVQLERLDQDYKLLEERIKEMNPKLDQKLEDVKQLKEMAKEKKRLREMAAKRDGITDQLHELKRQALWAQVMEREEIVAGYESEIAVSDAKIAEAQAQVQNLDAIYQQANQALQESIDASHEADAALHAAQEEHRQARNMFDEAKAEAATAAAELRNVGVSIKNATKSIQNQQELVRQEEQRLLEANGGGAARRLQELDAARETARQAAEDLARHKASKAEVEAALRQANFRAEEKQAERDTWERNVRQQREKLRDLQNKTARQPSAFRQNSDQLDRLIEQETRWQHKPIGPLGKYVRLQRPEWSSIIESMFGRTLTDYLVFSKRDSDLLSELKRRARCDAGIAITNRSPIVPREPAEEFATILRVLQIDNEYVQKYLIIQHAIEQHILIDDVKEATSAMYDNGRLHNVKGCFAFSPHDKTKGVLLKYTPSGEPSQDPVRAWSGTPRMKSDQEATMAAKRALLEDAEKELGAANAARQAARTEAMKADAARHRHEKRARELLIASQEAEDAVSALVEMISEDNVESGKLDALKTGLAEADENKKLMEEQFKDAVNAKDAKNQVMREHQQRLAEVDATVTQLQHRSDEVHRQHRDADARTTRAMHERNNGEARVRDAQSERQRRIDCKAAAQAELHSFEASALEQSGGRRVPVPDGETFESIRKRDEKLREDRRRYERQLGFTQREATEQAAQAEAAYAQSKRDLEELREARDLLAASLVDRRQRWHKFRRHITARAKVTFVYLLSERGFRGRILADHKTHQLDLAVEPDITRRSDQGRNAKTLSGGEKSFSQICLLLAMWEAMGSPVRCLDEFDVFMDAVNRNMSVKMITEAARESVGKQYILISPGSKSDIDRAPDVVVQDLGSPRRVGEDDGQRSIRPATGGLEVG